MGSEDHNAVQQKDRSASGFSSCDDAKAIGAQGAPRACLKGISAWLHKLLLFRLWVTEHYTTLWQRILAVFPSCSSRLFWGHLCLLSISVKFLLQNGIKGSCCLQRAYVATLEASVATLERARCSWRVYRSPAEKMLSQMVDLRFRVLFHRGVQLPNEETLFHKAVELPNGYTGFVGENWFEYCHLHKESCWNWLSYWSTSGGMSLCHCRFY